MAPKSLVPFLVAMMLATGVCNTLRLEALVPQRDPTR
jgi:hypothetical protein